MRRPLSPSSRTYVAGLSETTVPKVPFSALVSGNFPGSPVLLDHTFALTAEKITRLEIS
ncbi:MAG: hypothetical protein WCC84_02115 [Candidatus Cybelea sp.]